MTQNDTEQIQQVYAQYGIAMYQAQCVERQLAILVPLLHGLSPQNATRATVEQLLDQFFAQSFGQSISRLEKTVGLPKGFEHRLREALKTRNWLAHDYFWERAAKFMSAGGRAKMITELIDIAALLSRLDDELTQLSRDYSKSIGVSAPQFEQSMRQILESERNDT